MYTSVYEKLFETTDIMSDVLEPCVGHFHIVPDIISVNYDNEIKFNSIKSPCRQWLQIPSFVDQKYHMVYILQQVLHIP